MVFRLCKRQLPSPPTRMSRRWNNCQAIKVTTRLMAMNMPNQFKLSPSLIALTVSKYDKGEKSATGSKSSTTPESKVIKKLAPTSIPDSILAMLRAGRSIPKSKERVIKNIIIPKREMNGSSKSKAGMMK